MKMRHVCEVLSVAAATMAFTILAFGPWHVGVSADAKTPKTIKAAIYPPKYVAQGCEFTVKTDKPEYNTGDRPSMVVVATNPSAKQADATVWVTVSTRKKPNPMARMIEMPKPEWSQSWQVTLTPGETKTKTLTPKVKLAAGQELTITMGDKDQTVVARELSVGAKTTSQPTSKAASKTAPKTAPVAK